MNRIRILVAVSVAVVAAALATAFVAPAPPRLGPGHSGDADLAGRVRASVQDRDGLRGLAVAWVEDTRLRVAGVGTAADGRRVDGRTAFQPGSVTKTWTAMLLADMIARREVSTADTLGTLLPDRAFTDPAVRDITVEELVSHRSGLPPLPPRGLAGVVVLTAALRGADPYAGVGADDVLDAVGGVQLEDAKGTVRYSNFGMAVLGQALAVRAGKPYAELVTERVLAPIGMRDTVFRPDHTGAPAGAAVGTTATGRVVDVWSGGGYLPAGVGDWTTATDLGTFVSAVVAGTAPGLTAVTPRFRDDGHTRIGYA